VWDGRLDIPESGEETESMVGAFPIEGESRRDLLSE
jgi:hypothetical protein